MNVDSLIEDIVGEMHSASYPASPIKRRRATRDEMELRADFLIRYAEQHGPVTVRGLYYQAEVHGLPGIDKTENGYAKVQAQVLSLRRSGRLAYRQVADATRWMRKPRSFDDIEEAIAAAAALYRKNLWQDAADDDDRPYHVYYLGDFDRSGRDAANALREKLERFAEPKGIPIVFTELAVTDEQITDLGLPTRAPKRNSPADRNWPYQFACELDAIPPDQLRDLVADALTQHLPLSKFQVLKEAEASERNLMRAWAEARMA